MSWLANIARCHQLIEGKGQTNLVVIVSGSEADSRYWIPATQKVKQDTLRVDEGPQILAVTEEYPCGNFLGTLNAWSQLEKQVTSLPTQGVSLMSMVFGQGKRLSPFTQALGNRKAAFPTPFRGKRSGHYLCTGDIATLYSSLWMHQLASTGFHGVLVKWGDEATIPSEVWTQKTSDFQDVDAVRFVWKTEPTETYAKEKEWFVLDHETGLIVRLIPRQPMESLAKILQGYQGNRYSTAVNLGSVAVSYKFLETAREVLKDTIGKRGPAADWDPFVNLLLLNDEDSEGLHKAEIRCPGLRQMLRDISAKINQKLGRPPRVGFLEFGDALWIDLGLHTTLRKSLEALITDTDYGHAARALFRVPETRDERGNIILRSQITPGAHVSNSLIIDATIGEQSVIEGACVVASNHEELQMKKGGASLFCKTGRTIFEGERGVAFRSVQDVLTIPEGGRHTTFFTGEKYISLITNESIQRYDDSEYAVPILGNEISFQQAAMIASKS